jgi:hypothetical protein
MAFAPRQPAPGAFGHVSDLFGGEAGEERTISENRGSTAIVDRFLPVRGYAA